MGVLCTHIEAEQDLHQLPLYQDFRKIKNVTRSAQTLPKSISFYRDHHTVNCFAFTSLLICKDVKAKQIYINLQWKKSTVKGLCKEEFQFLIKLCREEFHNKEKPKKLCRHASLHASLIL